nr:sugar ABC transporter permease [Bacillus pinisoli]
MFKQDSWIWALLPAVALTFLFVGYGVGMSVLYSIYDDGNWTLENYLLLFKNKSFLHSLPYSLYITFVSTTISIILGIIISKVLYRGIRKNFSRLLIWIPMLFPHFVWGYILYLLLSQSGFISSLLFELGMIDKMEDFPIIFREQTGLGIILTYVWKETPFAVLMLLPILSQINQDEVNVVRTLGGNEWDVFKTVEWPRILPVVLETSIIIFSFVLSAVEVPLLLGVTYPKTLSVLSYDWFFEGDWSNRGLSYATMTIVSLFIISIMLLVQWVMQKNRYRMMKGNGS